MKLWQICVLLVIFTGIILLPFFLPEGIFGPTDGHYETTVGIFQGTHYESHQGIGRCFYLDIDNDSLYISEDYEGWNFNQYIGKDVTVRTFAGCGRRIIQSINIVNR